MEMARVRHETALGRVLPQGYLGSKPSLFKGLFLLQMVAPSCSKEQCGFHVASSFYMHAAILNGLRSSSCRQPWKEKTPGVEILIILMVNSFWLALDGTAKQYT